MDANKNQWERHAWSDALCHALDDFMWLVEVGCSRLQHGVRGKLQPGSKLVAIREIHVFPPPVSSPFFDLLISIFPRIFLRLKQCSYCGKEYPDDTTVCVIDGQTLDPEPKPTSATAHGRGVIDSVPETRPSDPIVIWPEYQWTQRDAWLFLLLAWVVWFLWPVTMRVFYVHIPHFYDWLSSPLGYNIERIIFAASFIFIAAYFARTDSVASFCKAVGLDRKPTSYAWFGVTAALGIRLIGHVIYVLGWAKSYPSTGFTHFIHWQGFGRYFFLLSPLYAPFWEEPVNRGFLYKAFRGSYSAPISAGFIIAWTALTHWDQYRHFGWAVISLTALTIVQCALREKSNSLWDCILCHFVFNASNLIVGGFPR